MTNAGVYTVTKHCPQLRTLVAAERQLAGEILQVLDQRQIRLQHPCRGRASAAAVTRGPQQQGAGGQRGHSPRGPSLFDGIVLGMF